jgi:four helix bundle protein
MKGTLIESYQDLRVWKEAMDIAELCYRLTKGFPKEEAYGMTSQIRRAAVSIPANIAEGYGRGRRNEYVQFLRIAQGSLKELETHLILVKRVELAPAEAIDYILKRCDEIGKPLRSLIHTLQSR